MNKYDVYRLSDSHFWETVESEYHLEEDVIRELKRKYGFKFYVIKRG